MTHAVDEVSRVDIVTQWTRSLNLHSCAGGFPLAPDCRDAGCVDCHYGNGGVHGDEGDVSDDWGVLLWCSKGSATPGDESYLMQSAEGLTRRHNELSDVMSWRREHKYAKSEMVSYLFQLQVVVGSALNSTPSLRPLPCAPSMLGGGRYVAFGALQEASHQTPSHLKDK